MFKFICTFALSFIFINFAEAKITITVKPKVSDITQASAYVSWSLSEAATGQVQYGLTSKYGSVTTLEASFNYSSHSQKISGLKADTTYHYRVVSKNSSGQVVRSADRVFKTLANLVPPPPISSFELLGSPTVSGVTETSATVQWSLSEKATGQIEYGLTTAYGSTTTPELSFDYSTHQQTISGLKSGQVYHYRVVSKNAGGQQVVSEDKTFTTLGLVALPPPPAPPSFTLIAEPVVSSITETSAAIRWSLSEAATGQVQYGLTNAYGSATAAELSFDYSTHQQTISGLVPGKTYHFRVVSKNSSGVQVVSANKTFTTLGAVAQPPVSGAWNVTYQPPVFFKSNNYLSSGCRIFIFTA